MGCGCECLSQRRKGTTPANKQASVTTNPAVQKPDTSNNAIVPNQPPAADNSQLPENAVVNDAIGSAIERVKKKCSVIEICGSRIELLSCEGIVLLTILLTLFTLAVIIPTIKKLMRRRRRRSSRC